MHLSGKRRRFQRKPSRDCGNRYRPGRNNKIDTIIYSIPEKKADRQIRMLNILFSSRKSKEEIKKELEEDYGITMDDGYGREIDTMCNLSYMFEERGMKRGMKTGLERGIAEVAGNLILMGKDNAFIRKATALSEEAIERLREQVPTGQKR